MAEMVLHILNARSQLSGCRDWLEKVLLDAFKRSAAVLPLGQVDVVVKAGTFVIPEKGHVSWAPEPGIIYLTVDPDHPALRQNVDRSLERMLAHELHHCARWDGPGYGGTLGEALVSEGLAGHFAQEIYGPPVEPWECVPDPILHQHVANAQGAWDSRDYGHNRWFFGSGDLPRWLGYSLGFQIVARSLAETQASASGLVQSEAGEFRTYLDRI